MPGQQAAVFGSHPETIRSDGVSLMFGAWKATACV